MHNKVGSCKIVAFQETPKVDEKFAEFAESFFSVVEINFQDNGNEQLVGYMRMDCSEQDLLFSAQQYNVKLPPYTIKILESKNWLADNVIEFAPVEVEDFYVYGIHEKHEYTGNKIGIKVYAATAFGSEHQTTKCCLRAISDIYKLNSDARYILDVGTGSGILAIAAAKLWRKAKIVAVDIDDESVAVTGQNALDNGVAAQIINRYSDGYQAEIVQQYALYDVIFANILARPLIAMAADMAKNLCKGGYAVISGFIDEQVDWVVGEHNKHGLIMQKLYKEDNWCAALLKKE